MLMTHTGRNTLRASIAGALAFAVLTAACTQAGGVGEPPTVTPMAMPNPEVDAAQPASAGPTPMASDPEPAVTSAETKPAPKLEIITLLPKDGIPAIFDPGFVPASDAGESVQDSALVIGLSVGGDSRAYPVAFLSSHEIVNDVVGGKPVAVTW